MSPPQVYALLPLSMLAGFALIVLSALAIRRSYWVTTLLTLLGLALTVIACVAVARYAPRQVTPLLIIDRFALYYIGLLSASSFIIALLAYHYWERCSNIREEFSVLLLLGTLGAAVMVGSTHFASFFLGLEILSVSIYGMVAYHRQSLRGIEAGIKYLILAGVASAFILFGMALIYAQLGTMQLTVLAGLLTAGAVYTPLLLTGLGMIIVGISFKLALFPFHLWTPDVYEGAPAPVAAFIATVAKGAMFALLLRYFSALHLARAGSLFTLFSILAIASMFGGNFLALSQQNLKRLLAYSSIANMGYLLVAFLAGGQAGVTAVSYYLTAYFITILAAFGVITALSGMEREAGDLEEYHGLAWRRPWLGGVLTACMLSLAGIPLTAGFIGKFFIITAGVGARLWLLVILLALNSGLGLYYYLRVAVTLYQHPGRMISADPLQQELLPHAAPVLAGFALAVLAVLLLGLGIYPAPVLKLIQTLIMRY